MNILHVIGRFDRDSGGAQRVVASLANLGSESGESVVLYFLGDGSADTLLRDEVQVMRGPGEREIALSQLGAALATIRTLRMVKPDLVHVHSARYGPMLRVCARLMRVPVVTTLHIEGSEHGRLARWLELISLSFGHGVVAVSDAVSMSYGQIGGQILTRFSPVTIPNGVEPLRPLGEDGCASLRRSLGIPPEAVMLLNAARLHPQKNQSALIEAFGLVARDNSTPEVHLVIAGGGDLESSLRALVLSTGLEGRVHLLGRRSDVSHLMSAADVFVMPSLREGLSIAQLEALSAALPMVVSDIPSMASVAPEAAVLVNPLDVVSIARGMTAVIEDEQLRVRLGQSARAAFARHSSGGMWASYEALYRGVI